MSLINCHWKNTVLHFLWYFCKREIYIFPFFIPTSFVASERPAGKSHLVSVLRIFPVEAKSTVLAKLSPESGLLLYFKDVPVHLKALATFFTRN